METPSTPTPYQMKRQLAAEAAAAGAIPLTKKAKESVMRQIEVSKQKDVKYIDCVVDGKNGDKVAVWPPPSSPPWTTWSGLMLCAPNSPHAKRLGENCGGILITEEGKEFVGEGKAAAVLGFWTAPEDWQEMLAEMRAMNSWTPPDNWHETLMAMRKEEEKKRKEEEKLKK
jgi:hypothetical protein